jgi:hypothetical protein
MATVSPQIVERSRKNVTTILKSLSSTGQTVAASFMGVSESTVSRMKDQELEKLSDLLAACGLKVVPESMQCFPAEHVEALRILALQSSVLNNKADQLRWD